MPMCQSYKISDSFCVHSIQLFCILGSLNIHIWHTIDNDFNIINHTKLTNNSQIYIGNWFKVFVLYLFLCSIFAWSKPSPPSVLMVIYHLFVTNVQFNFSFVYFWLNLQCKRTFTIWRIMLRYRLSRCWFIASITHW